MQFSVTHFENGKISVKSVTTSCLRHKKKKQSHDAFTKAELKTRAEITHFSSGNVMNFLTNPLFVASRMNEIHLQLVYY